MHRFRDHTITRTLTGNLRMGARCALLSACLDGHCLHNSASSFSASLRIYRMNHCRKRKQCHFQNMSSSILNAGLSMRTTVRAKGCCWMRVSRRPLGCEHVVKRRDPIRMKLNIDVRNILDGKKSIALGEYTSESLLRCPRRSFGRAPLDAAGVLRRLQCVEANTCLPIETFAHLLH